MANKPLRPCPKCLGLWDGQVCVACGHKAKRYGWQSDRQRGTRQQRGYDEPWLRLSNAYRKRHPLCEECKRHGRVEKTEHIDHIIPFDGIDDPKRLDWNNLQALCKACHMRKTAREDRHR